MELGTAFQEQRCRRQRSPLRVGGSFPSSQPRVHERHPTKDDLISACPRPAILGRNGISPPPIGSARHSTGTASRIPLPRTCLESALGDGPLRFVPASCPLHSDRRSNHGTSWPVVQTIRRSASLVRSTSRGRRSAPSSRSPRPALGRLLELVSATSSASKGCRLWDHGAIRDQGLRPTAVRTFW